MCGKLSRDTGCRMLQQLLLQQSAPCLGLRSIRNCGGGCGELGSDRKGVKTFFLTVEHVQNCYSIPSLK